MVTSRKSVVLIDFEEFRLHSSHMRKKLKQELLLRLHVLPYLRILKELTMRQNAAMTR